VRVGWGKMDCSQSTPAPLCCSTVPCGGCFAESAEKNCVWHGTAPGHSSQRLLLQHLCCKKILDMDTK